MSSGPDKLASLGGPAFRAQAADPKALVEAFGKSAAKELSELLRAKNGYFAFESALRVFSDRGSASDPGLVAWNAADGWRKDYDGMADGLVFFAEDVFGAQFCLRESEVLLLTGGVLRRSHPLPDGDEGQSSARVRPALLQ